MLRLGKNGQDFIIVHDNGQLILNRQAAKDLCRFIMLELNIVKAELNDGRKIHEIDQKFIDGLKNKKP